MTLGQSPGAGDASKATLGGPDLRATFDNLCRSKWEVSGHTQSVPLLWLGIMLALGKPKTDNTYPIIQIVGTCCAETGPPETPEMVACEGEQNMPPQHVPLWHVDYSKVKVIKTQLTQGAPLPLPSPSKRI